MVKSPIKSGCPHIFYKSRNINGDERILLKFRTKAEQHWILVFKVKIRKKNIL